MKDLPHHIKKLNRKVIRSIHRSEMEEEAYNLEMNHPHQQTERQIKKQAKEAIRQEKKAHVPEHLTPEEKNKKMKHRTPVFDRFGEAPRRTKPTRKHTPPL